MVRRGIVNSRMKDFYDLYRFALTIPFDGVLLSLALQRTFERRGTAFVPTPPVLTEGFADDTGKETQWRAFRRSLGGASVEAPEQFVEAMKVVRSLVGPVYAACREGRSLTSRWSPLDSQWQSHEKSDLG